MWLTTDGRWKVTSATVRGTSKLRVSRWSDILNDWEKYGHVSSLVQLGRYFSLANLIEYPDIPDTLEGFD